MIAVNIDKLAFTYFSEPVFSNLSWEIHDDRVVGLVGPNGSGKSTLLQLIDGSLIPESGHLLRNQKLTTGYLTQEPDLDPNNTLWKEVTSSHNDLWSVERELETIERLLGDPGTYNDHHKLSKTIDEQARLIEKFNKLGGPGFDGHVRSILSQLGLHPNDFSVLINKLSGGQRKMVGLAKLIITKPDLLLLDEPDNHLDIQGKDFLINFIRSYQGAVIIVSHDRYLLDLTVDEIVDLDHGTLKVYTGNYSEFIFEKQINLSRQKQVFQAQQKEIKRLEQSAKRLLSWGHIHDNEKFIKRGKNILKRLERMDRISRPILEDKPMGLELDGWRGSNKVLEIQGLDKVFIQEDPKEGIGQDIDHDEVVLFKNCDYIVWHGDRVGLIGPNGSGKSVLFQMILGNQTPTNGTITLGPSIQVGYYSQEHQNLNYDLTLIETIRQTAPLSESNAVAFLGRFRFGYEQSRGKIHHLSGGERSRLQMAMLMLSGANFLLLDEPTNNLDIQSAEVLEDELSRYRGTILVISHDRYFLDRVVGKIIEINKNKLESYLGNYSEYQKHKLKFQNSQGG